VGEKFRRAAAGLAFFRDRRKIGARQTFIVDMAFAAGHEDENAAQADVVARRNLGLDEGAVAAAAQHLAVNPDFAGKRTGKGNLRGQQRRQIRRRQPGRLEG
jgi:hypothetical protein